MKIAERKETIMQFDCGSTVFTTDDFSNQDGRWLYVQCSDSYGFQRELILQWDERVKQVQVHSYLHPFIRNIHHVPKRQAEQFMECFIKLCKWHPNLLFNNPDYKVFGGGRETVRARGFINVHTALLGGHKLNKSLL